MIYKIPKSLKNTITSITDNIDITKDNLAIIRFEIMKDLLQDNNISYTIVVPTPLTMRVWDSREGEYQAIDASTAYSTDRLAPLAKEIYSEEGCIDEWNKSLSVLSCIISKDSVLYIDQAYQDVVNYQNYVFRDNLKFYDNITTELQRWKLL